MGPRRRRVVVMVAALGAAAVSASVATACFVGIDESLLDRKEAGVPDVPDGDDGDQVHDSGGGGQPAIDPSVANRRALACGDASCQTPLVCCANGFGNTDYRQGSCFAEDDCPSGDFFRCVSAHDCDYAGSPGPLCCVVRDPQAQGDPSAAWTASICGTSCDAGALCFPGEPATCPSGKTCAASAEFPALYDCK